MTYTIQLYPIGAKSGGIILPQAYLGVTEGYQLASVSQLPQMVCGFSNQKYIYDPHSSPLGCMPFMLTNLKIKVEL